MLPIKYLKPLSLESWLLCVGVLTAIASLVTIDHYNITQTKKVYLTETSSLPSSVPHLAKGFDGLPMRRSAQSILAQAIPAQIIPAQIIPTKTLANKITAPSGWRAVQVSEGVTAYVAPQAIASSKFSSDTVGNTASNTVDEIPDTLDGTRSPYVTEIDLADILANPIAPQRYVWHGVWQGEGYSREHDAEGSLVSQQEGGNDINLTLSYNAAITNPQEPNLIITIESQQDKTAQLTNLSAFLLESQTGKTLERKDFAQLPPFYQVSLSHDGTEKETVKSLQPLGTVTFAYHVSASELSQRFPIELQAVNQFANQRAQEIAALEAQGWIVKEVPARNML